MGILSNWPNHHPKKRANFWLRTVCSSTKDFPSSKLTSKTFKNRVLASNSEHHLGHSKASRNWHSHLSHGCSTLRPASIFLYKRAPWNPYFLWGELCHSPPGHVFLMGFSSWGSCECNGRGDGSECHGPCGSIWNSAAGSDGNTDDSQKHLETDLDTTY